jgi:dipeptidyl aminopeptidase/acylaminoacyl peptidase
MLSGKINTVCVAVLFVGASASAGAVNVGAFIKRDRFETIIISPTGEYFAATVPMEDRTALMIGRRADMTTTASVQFGKDTGIVDIEWVNAERVVIGMADAFGELEEPIATGELYAINADGSKAENLIGYRVEGRGPGTRIQPKKVETVYAEIVDTLPGDDRNVIISVSPFSADAYTRAEKMDVYTGRRNEVARAPVRRATFTTDIEGVVRFARGSGIDNVSKLYYRASEKSEWKLINDETVSGYVERALGFSADGKTAFLEVEQSKGPNAIVAMDVASGIRKQVLSDDDTDPSQIIRATGSSEPVGAFFIDGKPRTGFFEDASSKARLYKSLEAAFPGESVFITSSTNDARYALIQTYSDRNPGDFYIFDTVAKKADHLISRRNWLDPEQMSETKPVTLTARDGLPLKGYLTLPRGAEAKNLPMVVLPHGGPIQVQDTWGFDDELQMLAAAGYAVLQVNFRGSSGYGRAHTQAGAREWGGKMQDDLTDATHWAVQQGFADSDRICIYGASYGGYAALMGVAKEPSLYKCAVGYVGVYDLPAMYTEQGVQGTSRETYLREWVGKRDQLDAISPTRMASRIKAPVFLAAGGEDKIAPISHTRSMEKALRSAGVPVETLYYDTEGHGFYTEAHRMEYYAKLLAFLARYLGGATATTSPQ